MPNAEFQRLQAELDQIRDQVKSPSTAALPACDAAGLEERLAAQTLEFQSLRARAELYRYRQEMLVAELKKQLALSDRENARLHAALEALMADHASSTATQQLKQELDDARIECVRLRHEIDGSLALKLARALPWLLKPIRALLAKRPPSPEARL